MIGRMWQWLTDRHRHEWETIEVGEAVRVKDETVVGKVYTLRCKVCGDVESRKIGWLA